MKTIKIKYGILVRETPLKESDPLYWPAGGVTTRKIYKTVNDKVASTPGDYGDGFFCGLRCAYQFAVNLADHGRRLEPKEAGR